VKYERKKRAKVDRVPCVVLICRYMLYLAGESWVGFRQNEAVEDEKCIEIF